MSEADDFTDGALSEVEEEEITERDDLSEAPTGEEADEEADDADDAEESEEESEVESEDEEQPHRREKVQFINEAQNIKKVKIVPHDQHITSNMLSVYEMTKAVGIRAQQIQRTGITFVTKPVSDDPIMMARQEMNERKCPLLIMRNIDAEGEYVEIKRVNEMERPYVYDLA